MAYRASFENIIIHFTRSVGSAKYVFPSTEPSAINSVSPPPETLSELHKNQLK